jgi:hypothetical protein
MLCIARRVGPGFVPSTMRWKVTHCADAPDIVRHEFNVLLGDEPEDTELGVFEVEPADQFLRHGQPLEALLRAVSSGLLI